MKSIGLCVTYKGVQNGDKSSGDSLKWRTNVQREHNQLHVHLVVIWYQISDDGLYVLWINMAIGATISLEV